jgi:ribonuclease HI
MSRRLSNAPDRDRRLILYIDGSINPARSGAGVVALDRHNRVWQVANRALPVMTNNEAEYMALLLAFEVALGARAVDLDVRSDSEIVVGQMIGNFAVNSPRLKALHQQACGWATRFQRVTYTHIPREENSLADALAGEASSGRRWCTFPQYWER